mgnify:CR=1 FL=1
MNGITFGEAWNYGGPLMWVLAMFSGVALSVMLYLFFAHNKGSFIKNSLERLKAAKDPEAEGARIATRVYASVDWLADIAAIAPLVGLLGTVLGMIQTFFNMAQNASGVIEISALSEGMYQAMVTTVGGLVVGILAMFAYNLLVSRIDRVVRQLESRTMEFMDLLNEPA